jgi:hypothetical protein
MNTKKLVLLLSLSIFATAPVRPIDVEFVIVEGNGAEGNPVKQSVTMQYDDADEAENCKAHLAITRFWQLTIEQFPAEAQMPQIGLPFAMVHVRGIIINSNSSYMAPLSSAQQLYEILNSPVAKKTKEKLIIMIAVSGYDKAKDAEIFPKLEADEA